MALERARVALETLEDISIADGDDSRYKVAIGQGEVEIVYQYASGRATVYLMAPPPIVLSDVRKACMMVREAAIQASLGGRT